MNDTVCKNWFMRKSGKTWVYGCALVSFVGYTHEATRLDRFFPSS